MRIIDLTEATETLATYAADVAQEPVIIMVAGKPAFLALIERSRARHQAEGGVSSAEVRRRVGLRNAE